MNIDNPKLVIIAGPNGSGKTSATGKIPFITIFRKSLPIVNNPIGFPDKLKFNSDL